MDGRSGMRAADADREATAERLRVALEEGRLNLHEYDERLGRAYGAKTYGDLDAVLADLPGPAPAERSALAPVQRGTEPAPVPEDEPVAAPAASATRWLIEAWLPWLRVAGILTAVWLFSCLGARELFFYWPVWALGPWGFVLLMRTAGGLATGEPRRAAERREHREAERQERREDRRERRETERRERREARRERRAGDAGDR
ncbi:DUF1707 domain-containing protein [Micromonospora sp. NPDC048999]|uniref:DUF1707 SHOCT-like domain-containing protein n=1 Tax=Micromonospora sp. NPDC048999 TaxID=3155391 RepID=UPI0033F09286